MPLSFAPIEPVEVDGEKKWNARCRACGEWVCEKPQAVKAAVDYSRRIHGPEKLCTRGDA